VLIDSINEKNLSCRAIDYKQKIETGAQTLITYGIKTGARNDFR